MDLGLLDGKGFELVVVLDRRVAVRGGWLDAPSPPGTVAVGELRYGRNAPRI
jgi:hypothetical protein